MRIALAAAAVWITVSLAVAVGVGRLLHEVEHRARMLGRRSTARREDVAAGPFAPARDRSDLPERRYGT